MFVIRQDTGLVPYYLDDEGGFTVRIDRARRFASASYARLVATQMWASHGHGLSPLVVEDVNATRVPRAPSWKPPARGPRLRMCMVRE